MDKNSKKPTEVIDPYFDEVKAKTSISFDFVLWFYRLLKNWYFFVISLILFLSYAYIKNKSWVPVYNIQAMLILEDRGKTSIVNGVVPQGSILGNTENQQIVLESYGMTERTVKNLPQRMRIDYFIQTHFKHISLYSDTPIEIEIIELKPEAYSYTYDVSYIDDNKCEITYKIKMEDEDDEKEYTIIIPYEKVVENKLFKIKLKKTETFKPNFIPLVLGFYPKTRLSTLSVLG